VGGLGIFYRSWRPAGKARGVVVHGFNSHSGQYTWVAEQLVAGSLAVYALDLRGRGKSDGERFYDTTGSTDKTLKLYQGAFHDLLNDFDKSVVMEDTKGWIRARLSPAA
jgi:alpha-beta hydrolase superfamily lysophospholipase